MLAKKELEERCRQSEDKLYTLKKDLDQAKTELEDKRATAQELETLASEQKAKLEALTENLNVATAENSTHISESMEKIKAKDLIIESMTQDIRQLKQTVKNQETSASYFKRQIEDL